MCLVVGEDGSIVNNATTTFNFTGTGVAVTSPTAGQVNVDITGGGGGTTPVTPAHAIVDVTPTQGNLTAREVGTAFTQAFTVTVGSTNPGLETFTFNRISHVSASVGNIVASNNTATLTATPAAGTTSIRVRITVEYSGSLTPGTEMSTTIERNILVGTDWFQALSTTVPANNAAMTSAGIYNSGVTHEFIGTAADPSIYIALPTRTGGYDFRSGTFFVNATEITTGYTQSGYTLYALGTLGSGETITVEVIDG